MCLALVACGPTRGSGPATTPRDAPPGTLALVSQLAPVGRLERQTSDVQIQLALKHGDQTIRVRTHEHEVTTSEVLARSGDLITKLRVRFDVKQETAVKDEGQKQAPAGSPLHGRTFVLELRGGQRVVTDEAGKPVDAKVAALVLREQSTFGKPDPWHAAAPKQPIRVGERVPSLEAAMKQQLSSAKEVDEDGQESQDVTDQVTMTLEKAQVEDGVQVGVFAVSLVTRVLKGGQPFMTMRLSGTVVLRARDGWPVRMELAGPMDVSGQPDAGRMTARAVFSYPSR
jgi:hypothetical protein